MQGNWFTSLNRSRNSFLTLIAIIWISNDLVAQSVELSGTPTYEMRTCGDPGILVVELINDTTVTLKPLSFRLTFPTGIQYVSSSLAAIRAGSFSESDISNLEDIQISGDSLPVGDTLSFQISYQANCDAADFQQAGNLLENIITVSYNGTSNTIITSSYNLVNAALSITNVNPTSHTGLAGSTFNRSITIFNGGTGALDTLRLSKVHSNDIQVVASDIGTLNTNGDTITVGGADFQGVGNADNLLDPGESITITETVAINGCNSANTVFDAFWGCDDNIYCQSSTSSSTSNSNTVVTTEDPSLSRSLSSGFNSCLGESNYNHQIRLVNTGSGPSVNTEITISKTSSTSYSEIISTGLSYRVGENGTDQTITISDSTVGSVYSCLSSSPVSQLSFSLPNIQPGDTVYIDFQTYTCCINTCGSAAFNGWSVTTVYDNACATKSWSHTNNGESEYDKNFTLYTESPASINNGETKEWLYRISSATFNLPDQAGGLFELEFDLPAGLIFGGSSDDLTFRSGSTIWNARNISYDTTSRSVLAQYELPVPTNFNFLLAEAVLELSLDCDKPSTTAGYASTSGQMFYQADSTCTGGCRIPMTCEENTSTYLFCPEPGCTEGVSLHNVELVRTNFGQPDNDQDGLADSSGSLDMSKVQDNRLMYGDTLRINLDGVVSNSSLNFDHGYASSKIPLGTNLSSTSGSLIIYDASANSYLNCSNVSISKNLGSNDTATFVADISVSSLQTAGCSGFSSFVYEDGDSIWLDINLRVSTNIGAQIEEVTTINQLYLSEVSNPGSASQYACNWLPYNITLLGYAFSVSTQESRTVRNCTQTVYQDYYLTIGPCCTNYEGGNLFPYEYRNWAEISQAKVWIPSNYAFISANFQQNRTTSTGNSTTESESNITYDNISGDTLYFDLSQYLVSSGGSINPGDDGFSGRLTIELDPICTTPQNNYENVGWSFLLDQSAELGGGNTGYLSGTNDRIRFVPADLTITPVNPIVDGLNTEVTFELSLANNSTNRTGYNVWFSPVSPSGKLAIDSVYLSSGTVTQSGDIYQLGNLSSNSSNSIFIRVLGTECNLDSLRIYFGADCDGYPSSIATSSCPYDSSMVYVEPKDAELAITYTPQGEVDVCNPEFSFSLRVASTLYAYSKDITVDIEIPPGMSIENGSSLLRYPISGSYASISDPIILNDSTLRYQIDSLNTTIESEGLPGVTNFSYSRFDLAFDFELDEAFENGDRFEIYLNGNSYCGSPITQDYVAHPKIYVESPLSSTFFQDTSAVFSNDPTDSWSISWVDIEGDGDQDLFATNYDLSTPNSLYINNGNGTFTQNTSNAIVQDIGPSTSSAWIDFDNDGDMDGFITNDIGTGNWLYVNDGSGSFSKLTATANSMIAYKGYSFSSAWGDYDNDGYLDLFICDYQPTKFNLLYHNNGDNTFSQVSGGDISNEAFYSSHASWADYDADGDPDLFLCNDLDSPNRLYRNDGNGSFTSVLESTFGTESNSSGAVWGDYDNDGDLDLYVANNANQYNFLYQNNGNGTFTRIFSGDIAIDKGNSRGCSWVDYDNDGYLDLFVTNDNAGYKLLYKGNGDGTFSRISNELTTALNTTMATAWGDYDNDGDWDVAIATFNDEANILFKNSKGKCNSFARLCLSSSNSNGFGIGSLLRAKANIDGTDIWQSRLVGSNSGGTLGQSDVRTIMGFGDATSLDSLIITWPNGITQYETNISLNNTGCLTYSEPTLSLITGTVYDDANGNCVQDSEEGGIPNVTINVSPSGRNIVTDSTGGFEVYVEDGTHTIMASALSNWIQSCNTSYELTTSGGNTYPDNDFAFTPGCGNPDLLVEAGNTPLRRGFTANYVISYENIGGSDATEAQLTVDYGQHMKPASAEPMWDSLDEVNHLAFWDIGTIANGGSGTIYLEDSVLLSATITDSLTFTTYIEANETDCDPSNDTLSIKDEVVGAIDPNDILWYPKEEISPGEWLTYRIRFQNVGNFYATYVTVIDTLPESVDLNTLKIEVTSHPAEFTQQGRVLTWRFIDINLPDSTTDEAGSHGFIQFHIEPNADIRHGTRIDNRAAIIFDFNEAIITNTASVRADVPNRLLVAKGLAIQPNPIKDKFKVSLLPHPVFGSQRISGYEIYDSWGSLIHQNWGLEEREIEIEVRELTSGMYYLTVYDVNRRAYTDKISVIK